MALLSLLLAAALLVVGCSATPGPGAGTVEAEGGAWRVFAGEGTATGALTYPAGGAIELAGAAAAAAPLGERHPVGRELLHAVGAAVHDVDVAGRVQRHGGRIGEGPCGGPLAGEHPPGAPVRLAGHRPRPGPGAAA